MLLNYILKKLSKIIVKIYSSEQLYEMYYLKIITKINNNNIKLINNNNSPNLIKSHKEDYNARCKLKQRDKNFHRN